MRIKNCPAKGASSNAADPNPDTELGLKVNLPAGIRGVTRRDSRNLEHALQANPIYRYLSKTMKSSLRFNRKIKAISSSYFSKELYLPL